ncbi:KpsF/GutQ family sugar-phosphate isomerase [Neorhodopirellula lusitana]|uniref:KpsF/GutQ family sugar-phosphate isomerase n=1 Tax=Neorhodopirellula lusitana TaxID=445327 RepID=UPI00384C4C81
MSPQPQSSRHLTSARPQNARHQDARHPHGPSPSSLESLPQIERIRTIRDTMLAEADAIRLASEKASGAAVEAAQRIAACQGSIVLTGVGKAGWIAQKIVATLASTGSPAHFLHPSEAIHGDLGRVQSNDVVIAFSNSGRSEEVVRVCQYLKNQASELIAITATENNPLAEMADLVVPMGNHPEACPNGLAPTSSTTVMLALGDAIAMLASKLNGFAANDFAKFHPGGALGRKLANVDDIMRPIEQCRVAADSLSIREAIRGESSHRRSGAVMLVDADQCLTGIFTDSDLVKLLQQRQEMDLDRNIADVMTRGPVVVQSGQLLGEAVSILSERHLSELPVVDDRNRPLGMIDITDLIAAGDIQPEPKRRSATAPSAPAIIPFSVESTSTKDPS